MAKLKKCPACNQEVSSNAPICPSCGHRLKKNHGCLLSVLIFIILASVGITMALSMGDNIQKGISGVSDSSEYISMDEYNSIETGMTYEKVQEIVGSPGEITSQVNSGGIEIIIVTWYGNGTAGSNANVTFTNNGVTAKAQIGLK